MSFQYIKKQSKPSDTKRNTKWNSKNLQRSNAQSNFVVQPKMKISQPGDMYEQEADRIAEQVMHMQQSGDSTVRKKCSSCEMKDEEEMRISRKSMSENNFETSDNAVNEINNIRGSGYPLEYSTRNMMESRFGFDFSKVRIHVDENTAKSAEAVNARAYTIGNEIMFGRGEYSPYTASGKYLLAHELTHVIQQKSMKDKTIQRYEIQGPWDINDPVHETITQEALKKDGLIKSNESYSNKDAWEYIRGTIWNDDPLGELFNENKKRTNDYSSGLEWKLNFDKAKKQSEKQKIGPADPLLGRSHFGDLQFLHGMASTAGELPEFTLGNIMMWEEFTYKVAIGEISGDQSIGSVNVEGFSNLFPNQRENSVKSFFDISNIGDVGKRAAGSLIHTIQDSYASGHTEREDLGNNRKGRIISFHDYALQDEGKHGHDDTISEFNVNKLKDLPGALDAVDKTAVILKLIDQKSPWKEAKFYLEMEVFGLVENPLKAGAGNKYRKKNTPLEESYKPTERQRGDYPIIKNPTG